MNSDDHVFKIWPFSNYDFRTDGTTNIFNHVTCKYCKYQTLKNSNGEYLSFNDPGCISKEEKMIKDLIE